MSEHEFKFETKQLHVGQEQADPATDARAVPIYQTTSFVFHNFQHAADRFALKDAGNVYGRLTNPTETVFAVGAGPQVAAVDSGSNYPQDAPRTDLSAYQPNAPREAMRAFSSAFSFSLIP